MILRHSSRRQAGQVVVATVFFRSSTPHHPGLSSTANDNSHASEIQTPETMQADEYSYGAYICTSCFAAFIEALADAIPEFDSSTRFERRLDSSLPMPRVLEMSFNVSLDPRLDLAQLRRHDAITRFERDWNVEAVFQLESMFRRHKRLAVFDMDSTLIQQEVIDEIARTLGVEAEVSAITARAMNGELDFAASLRARCRLLAGVSSGVWDELKARITLTPGASDLVRALKRLGFKTAVLSGGFMPLVTWLAERLGLDYAFANQLAVSDDGRTLTGELNGEIVDGERKRQLVLEISRKEGIPLEQTLVIGDGANDLPMIKVAGLGVAFHAKPKVQAEAPARLNTENMSDVLYLLGLSEEEQLELLQENLEQPRH